MMGSTLISSARSFLPALVIALLISLALFFSHCQRYLEFTLAFPGTAWLHLYPSRGGEAGNLKYKGVKVESSGRPVKVRIPLLPVALDALLLRIDNPGGTVSVSNIRLVNGRGELLAPIGRERLENSAASTLAAREGGVDLSPSGLSPIIDMRLNLEPLEPLPQGALMLFIKLFLPAAVIACLLAAVAGSVGNLLTQKRTGSISPPSVDSHGQHGGLVQAAGAFLIILGARLWLVRAFGSDLPFWDQWGAEATYLYIPYFRETLSLGDLFAAHNEHRILLTRIFSLGLLLLNGTWDPLLQMALNALLYASVGVLVLRAVMPTSSLAWSAAVPLLFALPFGWQNTLGGFQLQMYLLIGLSLLFLWLMTCAPSPRWQWLGGCLCAGLLLFTMASGFLAAAAFLLTAALLCCRPGGGSRFREMLPAMLLCLGVTVAGVLLKVTVPMHLELQATEASGFALAAAAYLGWPLSFFPVFGFDYPGAHGALFCSAALLWLPFMLLIRRFLRERHTSTTMTLVVATGFWTLLQVAAAAYARGANFYPSSRYQDIFAIGLLVNIASLCLLRQVYPAGRGAAALCGIALFWTMGSSAGLLLVTGLNAVHDLPEKRAQQEAGREHVRRFIETGDIASLTGKPRFDIPHHDREKLALLLVDPDIRRILPPTVTGSGSPGRLRPVLDLVLRSGPFIVAMGIICFCLALLRRKDRAKG